MLNDNENILFMIKRGPCVLGVFPTIGNAILGATMVMKADRCEVREIVIGILPEHDFIARVIGHNDVFVDVTAFDLNDNFSIDGIVRLA